MSLPVSQDVAVFLSAQADLAAARRAANMPTEVEAVRWLADALQRLQELGWMMPSSAPRDEVVLTVSAHSTGRHKATLHPDDIGWLHWDGEDAWCHDPLLWRGMTAEEKASGIHSFGLDQPVPAAQRPQPQHNTYLAAGHTDRRHSARADAQPEGVLQQALRTSKEPAADWSQIQQPDPAGIRYHHVWWDTPAGRYFITWKGWKTLPVYDASAPDQSEVEAHCSSLTLAKLACEAHYVKLTGKPLPVHDAYRALVEQHLNCSITISGTGDSHAVPDAAKACASAAAWPASSSANCSCPSGDGSLRHPCQVHPAPTPTSRCHDDGWEA